MNKDVEEAEERAYYLFPVLVCGGRDYKDYGRIKYELQSIKEKLPPAWRLMIISGAARGADYLAAEWAKDQGVICLTVPAQWDKYGKGAGFKRNQLMLAIRKPKLVVAFPGGSGTADMIRRAEEQGIRVHKIENRVNNESTTRNT